MPIRAAPEALAAANRGSAWSERDRHHLRHRVRICPRGRPLCDLPSVRCLAMDGVGLVRISLKPSQQGGLLCLRWLWP